MNGLSHQPLAAFTAHGCSADTAAWPADTRTTMKEIGVRNMLIAKRLATVLAKLAEVQVYPIVMKGTHLNRTVYPFGIRPAEDIDLLLDRRDYARADAALQSLGYANTASGMDAWTHVEVSNKMTYLDGTEPLIPIDVHYSLGPYPYLGRLSFEALRPHAELLDADGASMLVLKTELLLLHLCLHVFQHRSDHWHVSAHDLAAVTTVLGKQIRWEIFLAQVEQYALSLPVLRALEMAARVVTLHMPESVIDQLHRMPVSRAERRIYRASMAMTGGMEKYLLQFMTLPGLGRKLRCLRRIAFPRRAFLDRHFGGSYWRYAANVGIKSCRALVRAFR